MLDVDDVQRPSLDQEFRLYTRRLQLWRLCANAKCRRARACRGEPRRCVLRLADWAEAVQDAARREFNARDPETQALQAELQGRILRLVETISS